MLIEMTRPASAPVRTSAVAIAATSQAAFRSAIPALQLSRPRFVLVLGVARLNTWDTFFAPGTGLIKLDDMEAAAIRCADRAATAAASSLPMDVDSRHCVCSGWRDKGLRGAVAANECESLIVHASDLPAWRRGRVRRWLGEVGVSLVVVDAESR